jgi:uncharacterized coiled-coil DUF342 family protein
LRLTSLVAYDALKMAVDHVLGKIKEGKKLSTEEILVLYLGTIVNELKDVRSGVARLEDR